MFLILYFRFREKNLKKKKGRKIILRKSGKIVNICGGLSYRKDKLVTAANKLHY
jgi:hypothetical protein